MKLTDFDKKQTPQKALHENYKINFDVSKLNMIDTKNMLLKVRNLAGEAKSSKEFYENQANPSYMKLVFMEQALVNHYNDLVSQPKTKIVLENEKIEESQVYLAAQDLVDTVQKMLEDVGQMQVKELPALVSSIESEIGVNESQSFNDQVTQSLDELSSTLKNAMNGLKTAVNGLTGQEAADAAFAPPTDMEAPAGEEEVDVSADMTADIPEPSVKPEMPEAEPVSGVGRAKR